MLSVKLRPNKDEVVNEARDSPLIFGAALH